MDDFVDLLNPAQTPKVRRDAANILLGLTTEDTSLQPIVSHEDLTSTLWGCLLDDDKQVSKAAAQVFINLTSFSNKYRAPPNQISKLLSLLHNDKVSYLYDSVAKILNNASSSSDLAEEFSKLVTIPDCTNFIRLLSQNKEQGYLAAVMGNLAIADYGRELLTDATVLSDLLTLLSIPTNLLIRRNTARLMRNLSFDVKTHSALSNFLPQLVYPLVGGEEIEEEEMDKLPLDLQYLPESKSRESDLQTRILLSDTLFQLCGSYSVRELLRAGNYYVLLKKYDEWEEDSEGKERVQNVIYLLIQDDGEVDLRRAGEVPSGVEVLPVES